MILSHYSDNPVLSPSSIKQKDDADMKPQGLWLSVDGPDDWASWCESEKFRDIEDQYQHRVELTSSANILRITNSDELRDFHSKYVAGQEGRPWERYAVDWSRVATGSQGIIIAPYIWSERLGDIGWYYGWDCASGCIWDKDAIAKVELIKSPITPTVQTKARTGKNLMTGESIYETKTKQGG